MRIGIFGSATAAGSVDDVVADVRAAAEDGFATHWQAQVFGLDTLTALAVVGREVPGIELGTGVVPTYPRHPMMLAQQALTVQSAIGGRLCLGIGLSHKPVIEMMFHQSFEKPVRHLDEYLSVLLPLLDEQRVNFTGETLGGMGNLTIPGVSRPSVVVAALGPRMLDLAGRRTDGTFTWCVGPQTLASHTIPTIKAAAEAAGRPAPRIVAGVAVAVTDDVEAVRAKAATRLQIYGQLPSYRAMLDREGAGGAEDLVIAGNEAEVRDRLAAHAAIGVTDLAASDMSTNPDERARTRALLRDMAAA
ncbi:MAG TPA: TIGR03564 family F420-dependent LLM class oxidoreductase [Acidimicrobiales bacterium]